MAKQKQPVRAVMLEYINECGNWEWYGVYLTITPKRAIKLYNDAMHRGLKRPTYTGVKRGEIATDDARAYYIDIY